MFEFQAHDPIGNLWVDVADLMHGCPLKWSSSITGNLIIQCDKLFTLGF